MLHPAKFLDANWVDLKGLKKFISQQSHPVPLSMVLPGNNLPRCSLPLNVNPTHVKHDPDTCFLPNWVPPIKEEPLDALDLTIDTLKQAPVKINWQTIQEGGKEIIVLNDSEPEEEDIIILHGNRDDGMSSDAAVGDIDTSFDSDDNHATMDANSSDSDVT